MLKLGDRWVRHLIQQPETGMDYQIARVVLNDGRAFERVVIMGDMIYEVDRSPDTSFTAADIQDIKVRSGLEWDRHR
jgi:hypothetical protein